MSDLRNELEARLTVFIREEIARRLNANPDTIKLITDSLPALNQYVGRRLDAFEERVEELLECLRIQAEGHRHYLEGRITRALAKRKTVRRHK